MAIQQLFVHIKEPVLAEHKHIVAAVGREQIDIAIK